MSVWGNRVRRKFKVNTQHTHTSRQGVRPSLLTLYENSERSQLVCTYTVIVCTHTYSTTQTGTGTQGTERRMAHTSLRMCTQCMRFARKSRHNGRSLVRRGTTLSRAKWGRASRARAWCYAFSPSFRSLTRTQGRLLRPPARGALRRTLRPAAPARRPSPRRRRRAPGWPSSRSAQPSPGEAA